LANPEPLNVSDLQRQFPALDQQVHGHRLVYLDSAATTQKPQSVLEAVDSVYRKDCANVHRGVHTLSERATARYEEVRKIATRFLGTEDSQEIVFTRGVTESMNLLANTLSGLVGGFKEGDEVLITELEHHANIVPWQLLSQSTGIRVKVLPCDDACELVLDDLDKLVTEKTRIVSVGHVSNAIGTMNDIDRIFSAARGVGAITIFGCCTIGPPHGYQSEEDRL